MAHSVKLPDYLREMASRPFVWGRSDCCLAPSDWILARTGIDAAAPLRGRYGTAFGAFRHIAQRGGFEKMVADLMAAAGFCRTDTPQPGDVGVIITDQGLSFGIKTSRGWAAKSDKGVTCAPFKYLQAWTV